MNEVSKLDLPLDVSVLLYKSLYMIRRCEETIVDIYPDNEMKTPMHMSMGQEAVSVGVCEALERECDVFASYRSHATYLAQTWDHAGFFGELHGRVNGTADGKSGSMHLSNADLGMLGSSGIVAAGIPVALGAAFSNRHLEQGRFSIIFFGDGAIDEGSFWESLNAACVMGLPILFVCEDNDLAVHTRKDARRGFKSIIDVLGHYDCIVGEDETNDVESIYTLTKETIQAARVGGKPAFLNIRTYRYLEPCGTSMDTAAPYRDAKEDSYWKEKDCVAQQKLRLLEKGMQSSELDQIESEIDQQIQSSVDAARGAPHPPSNALSYGVFYEKD